jgi:hypothetical protein
MDKTMRAAKSRAQSVGFSILAMALLLGACATKTTTTTTTTSKYEAPEIVHIDNAIPLSDTKLPTARAYQTPTYDRGRYHALLIEPTTLYSGPEAGFDDVPEADRERIAAMLTSEFKRVLSQKFQVVEAPGPGVVRINMTLIGINQSRPVLSTALRLTKGGLVMSAARTIEQKGAPFTGSINVAGVAYDTQTGQVLVAAQALVSPPAINVTSGLTPLRAAELSTTRAAEHFRDYLLRTKARQ